MSNQRFFSYSNEKGMHLHDTAAEAKEEAEADPRADGSALYQFVQVHKPVQGALL